jgi:hypothetical protein
MRRRRICRSSSSANRLKSACPRFDRIRRQDRHDLGFLDPTTRTIKVRATLSNAQRTLKGEMYITAAINGDASNGTASANARGILPGRRHFVFVDSGDGRFARREVKVGTPLTAAADDYLGPQSGQKVVQRWRAVVAADAAAAPRCQAIPQRHAAAFHDQETS